VVVVGGDWWLLEGGEGCL